MYRDDSTHLDEHDRAVGAIQIADGLIGDCLRASKQLGSTEHRWRAAREINENYGEVWRQLDCARRLLATRGANTMSFDELREHVHPVLPLCATGLDTTRLEDARRAVAALRLAMPGADWKAIEARTKGLLGTQLVRRGPRIAVAGVAVVMSLAAVTWAANVAPEQPITPKVEAQLSVQQQPVVAVEKRSDRIDTLQLLIGGRCDRPRVTEFVELLVKEGRYEDAHGYGEDYAVRCGDDPEIRKWSKRAKKNLDRLSKL
jgi:hypothetical protein